MSDISEQPSRLPPYTYVPGFAPHPISHPEGHMHDGCVAESTTNEELLDGGRRLFDHGFYWEAHEVWEQLWKNLGRTSAEALIIKGLIKLAACGVKCREGNSAGATRHATRAAELLQANSASPLFAGMDLTQLATTAQQVSKQPPTDHATPSSTPISLPDFTVPNRP